jgi:hypothetical protein
MMLEKVSVTFGNIECFYKREGIILTKSGRVLAESEIVSVESESVSVESGRVLE